MAKLVASTRRLVRGRRCIANSWRQWRRPRVRSEQSPVRRSHLEYLRERPPGSKRKSSRAASFSNENMRAIGPEPLATVRHARDRNPHLMLIENGQFQWFP